MSANKAALAAPRGFGQLLKNGDILLAFGVIVIVSMMIVPVPEWLMDLLITVNIAGALTILLVALYVVEPLQFSVFPSMLLLTTLFRLSLNISATKLILLHAHAGKVIDAFGMFVVGGNYIVGIVVFLIIVIIQFVVITNGAGRVAEVAARFTLDAMPGKQMSIDADLNAGLIDEGQARKRRKAIENEANFYGAMDGASKFVKGDAIAGVAVIIINILGGFAIGVTQLGIPITEALQTYTILTIGEGLVSQIPAILISTATGILVTRAASESNLGRDAVRQMLANHRAILIVAGLLLMLGLIPGLPKLPFFLMSGAFGVVGFVLRQGAAVREGEVLKAAKAEPAPSEQESFAKLLHIDPIELNVGYGLVSLVDAEQSGNLLGRITLMRRQMALDLGIVIPTIRIKDSGAISPNAYIIKLREVQIASGELRPDRLLAMNPSSEAGPLDGISVAEPVFGLPALWVSAQNRGQAEALGYTVVDPSSVIATHLTEVIRKHAAIILGRQDVQNLINDVKAEYPALIEGFIPEVLSIADVHKILRSLLREQVSVRDLVSILETLAICSRMSTDGDFLTEQARQSLGAAICGRLTGAGRTLSVLTCSPALQDALGGAVQQTEQGLRLILDPDLAQRVIQQLAKEIGRMAMDGHQPVLLVSGNIRMPLRRLVERTLPNLAVLSYAEIPSQFEVRAVGMLNVEEY